MGTDYSTRKKRIVIRRKKMQPVLNAYLKSIGLLQKLWVCTYLARRDNDFTAKV